jgi:hypothetical protein
MNQATNSWVISLLQSVQFRSRQVKTRFCRIVMYEIQDSIVFAIVEDTQILPLDSLALAAMEEVLTDFKTIFRTKFDLKLYTSLLMCKNICAMELIFQFSTNRTLKIMTDNLLKKMYDDADPISAVVFSYHLNTVPIGEILEIEQDAAKHWLTL